MRHPRPPGLFLLFHLSARPNSNLACIGLHSIRLCQNPGINPIHSIIGRTVSLLTSSLVHVDANPTRIGASCPNRPRPPVPTLGPDLFNRPPPCCSSSCSQRYPPHPTIAVLFSFPALTRLVQVEGFLLLTLEMMSPLLLSLPSLINPPSPRLLPALLRLMDQSISLLSPADLPPLYTSTSLHLIPLISSSHPLLIIHSSSFLGHLALAHPPLLPHVAPLIGSRFFLLPPHLQFGLLPLLSLLLSTSTSQLIPLLSSALLSLTRSDGLNSSSIRSVFISSSLLHTLAGSSSSSQHVLPLLPLLLSLLQRLLGQDLTEAAVSRSIVRHSFEFHSESYLVI